MILLWFNPKHNKFYTKYYNNYFFSNYYVGYINSYGHEIIKIYVLKNGCVYDVNDYYHFCKISYKKNNKLLAFFKMLIDKIAT